MKTERFEMRLDRETLDDVDRWRAEQDDSPSRAEAVRQLADAGLSVLGKGSVRISDGEKIIVMMFRDVYKHLKIRGEIDPDFVSEAICSGHLWGLDWKYPGIFHSDLGDQRVVSEVADILTMWSSMEWGYKKLSKKEKERIAAEAEPFGKDVKFRGFDGNNESRYYSVALFLIEQLGRFEEFKKRDLNSHFPSLDAYRQMLPVFDRMKSTMHGGHLSAKQIIELLKAQFHPEGGAA